MPVVVGVGRSGTTLLRLMLDAHPDLAIPPETHFLYRLSKLRSKGGKLREEFLDTVLNTHEWADFHISEEVFRERLSAVSPFRVEDGVRLFYRLYAERFNKSRWGDKTPGYVLRMRAIQSMLPEAHFIHIIRDGRAVAASRRQLFFGPGSSLRDEANDWLRKITSAREQAVHLPHYLEVKYEALVSDPEKALMPICAFLDLPYSEAMLSYHKTASARIGDLGDMCNSDGSVKVAREARMAIHKNTSSSPDVALIDRWRTELLPEDVAQYNSIAGEMLFDLGYDVSP